MFSAFFTPMTEANHSSFYPARWWTRSNEQVQCDLCPRQCVIENGERGFCFVRRNVNGALLTFNGAFSSIAVDPIEKKPLYHFLPGSKTLSLGTIGCNLGCVFCQNWFISRPDNDGLLRYRMTPEEICGCAVKERCLSVAFTYNEPIIAAEQVIEVAKVCRENNLGTVAVTAGYIQAEARKDFFQYIDAVNIDLKSFSRSFYQKVCHANLAPVLDTILYLKHKTKIWVEITNLLISGYNDSSEEIEAMSQWIVKNLGVDVPLHFSAFHPDHHLLSAEATPKRVLLRARDIALRAGMRYVYTGNVVDMESTQTFCYICGKVLIERNGYDVKTVNIIDDHCGFCKTICPGHFNTEVL